MEYTVENCLKLLPVRYHDEFIGDVLVDKYSIISLRKVFIYYLQDIWGELNYKEKELLEEEFLTIEI